MTKMLSYAVVFITAANRAEADAIAGTLVAEKIVACVTIIPGVRSTYWWKGKIETADEVLLSAKTRQSNMPALIRRVKELHSYEVPEIVALPLTDGNPDYLAWIGSSTEPHEH